MNRTLTTIIAGAAVFGAAALSAYLHFFGPSWAYAVFIGVMVLLMFIP